MLPYSFRKVQPWTSAIVALSVLLQPGSLLAAPSAGAGVTPLTAARPIQASDVALQRGGILVGQIVNAAGVGVAEATVQLRQGKQRWQTRTDSKGGFQLNGLRGGSYQFHAAGQAQVLRVWAAGTAPPHARQGLLVAPQTDVVRCQRVVSPNTNQFFCVAKRRLANPWVVGGIVATAVAIPVAIHNADDDPPATP